MLTTKHSSLLGACGAKVLRELARYLYWLALVCLAGFSTMPAMAEPPALTTSMESIAKEYGGNVNKFKRLFDGKQVVVSGYLARYSVNEMFLGAKSVKTLDILVSTRAKGAAAPLYCANKSTAQLPILDSIDTKNLVRTKLHTDPPDTPIFSYTVPITVAGTVDGGSLNPLAISLIDCTFQQSH